MKNRLSAYLIMFFVGINGVNAQKIRLLLPSEVGLNIFSQRTQTIMHYDLISPYYNTYSYNKGIGCTLIYKLNRKWSLDLYYNYTKLMNTYDIVKMNPLFSEEDKRRYKPFSFYWVSNEIGIGYKYKFFGKKGYNLFFTQSICTNFGQLAYEHFPSKLGDSITRDIFYQDGKPAKLTFQISQISVRNMGLNSLNGIYLEKYTSPRFKISLNLSINYGFIPIIGSRINYWVTSSQKSGFIGEYYALSSNSGIRLGLGINYIIKKEKT